MSGWQTTNFILAILFLVFALFLWLRPYDGTGVPNTMYVKLTSLAVLAIFFAVIFSIEFIFYLILKNNRK
ncbi:DUF3923 family protein [uncultured Lactobacillus sp.]|uniref:DUF3923 family protein n=1 Tax=uncultured Lactobacillus sp. TaxID=153152 RepID=UPI0025E0CF13|nr:DUF3923 family protein [uncultured Lactobacillus sp.]